MSHVLNGCAIIALTATLAAQQNFTNFDCAPLGPLPAPPAAACESLSGVGASIVTSVPCGSLPTYGPQFAKITAGAAIPFLAPGAQIARPLPAGISELRVPLPAGTTYVDFDLVQKFESTGPSNNDGYDVSVCNAAGAALQRLGWVDSALVGNACAIDVGGPIALYGPTPAGAYLSFAVFNVGTACCGGSYVAVDRVRASATYDEAFTALNVGPCLHGPYTNGGMTTSPGLFCNGGHDRWFRYVATSAGVHTFSTVGQTSDDTVINVTDGLEGPVIGCNDDALVPPNNLASSVPVALAAGQQVYISVGGYLGASVTFGLRVVPPPPARLTMYSESYGTLSSCVSGGVPNSLYFTPMTLSAGAFPNDAFFGIDLSFLDAITQLAAGAPFFGAVSQQGQSAYFGPFGPGLSGVTVYAVLLDDVASPNFTVSPPVSFTVP
jgi:hypothetical protein